MVPIGVATAASPRSSDVVIELSPLLLEDGPRILSWRNNPEVSRYMYNDHPITLSEHDSWLQAAIHDDAQLHWVVRLDGEPVGLASVTRINRVHSTAEWAFYLASPGARGRGVGSVIEYEILEFVFHNLGLERLACNGILAFNEAVIALHESFGFIREGVLRSAIQKNNGRLDVVLMGQLRHEWFARRDQHAAKLVTRGLMTS